MSEHEPQAESEVPLVRHQSLDAIQEHLQRGGALVASTAGSGDLLRASAVSSEPGFYVLVRRTGHPSYTSEGVLADSFGQLLYLLEQNAPLDAWTMVA